MAEPQEPLTERELEIVRLAGTGLGNKEIAARLSLSPNTVKVHLRNIFTKLEARSRTEMTMIAIRNGWIVLEHGTPGIDVQSASVQRRESSQTATPSVTSSAFPLGDPRPLAPPDPTISDATGQTTTTPDTIPVAPNPQPLPNLAVWQRIILLIAIGLGLALLVLTLPANPGNASSSNDPLRISPAQPRTGLLLRDEASRWHLRTPLPAARARSAASTVGDLIYVIGGEVNQAVSGDVLIYEPVTNTWTTLNTPKPTPVANAPAATVNGRIYIAGGTTQDGNPSTALEVFDTTKGQWRTLAPMGQPVAGHGFAALDNQLYVFGGKTNKGITGASERYDIATNTWHSITSMPTPRTLSAAVTYDDRIYVVGGYNGEHELSACEYYTPANDAWNTCNALTVPRSGLGLVRVANNIFAIGGGMSGFLGFNERYDPATNRWTALDTPLTTDWLNIAVAPHQTEFYVFGGYSGGDRLAFTYVYEVFTNRVFVPAFQAAPEPSSKP
jgi:DNA-binding CsgD family transcriptional regulator/N-acetylneuraminic acid mutarotase